MTHSSAVFVFDPEGKARLLATQLTDAGTVPGVAADLKQLIGENEKLSAAQLIVASRAAGTNWA